VPGSSLLPRGLPGELPRLVNEFGIKGSSRIVHGQEAVENPSLSTMLPGDSKSEACRSEIFCNIAHPQCRCGVARTDFSIPRVATKPGHGRGVSRIFYREIDKRLDHRAYNPASFSG